MRKYSKKEKREPKNHSDKFYVLCSYDMQQKSEMSDEPSSPLLKQPP